MQETLQKSKRQKAEMEELVQTPGNLGKLWFEYLISKLRLPLWIGIPIMSIGPAVVLWSLGFEIRIATDFTGVPIVSLPLLMLNMVFLIGSSKFICQHAKKLDQYTATLTDRTILVSSSQLYKLTPIVLIWAALVSASGLVFDPLIFKLYYPFYQSILRVVVTSYLRLAEATFLWVLGYSMYRIYQWGKLPVRLKSFAEDPSLGLKPYGTASLYFVTLYVIGVLLTFPIGIYVGDAVRMSQSIFFLLGLAIFLVPLLGLRRKLLEAKAERLSWIKTRHKRVIELVESSGNGPLDTELVNELIAIDSIRRDIHQIHTWPFNPGILARVVTVVMLPLVLAMVATYLIHILQL